MSDALARSQDVIRSADRTARVLLVSTVALLVALATIFAAIIVRQNVLRDSIREDILWAIYQYDRESRTLAGLLDHYNSSDLSIRPSLHEITKRYDILYSRLTILDESRFGTAFDSDHEFTRERSEVRSMTLSMQGYFDKLSSGVVPGPIEVAKVNQLSAKLVDTTSDLLSKTNATVSAARADARADVISLQKWSGGVIIALCVTVSMLIYSLFRQIKLFRLASQELSLTAETLTNAYELAEAGNRAKSEFMATIGHEIRTPLNAILGMSELLSHARLESEDRESVSVIMSSGATLLEIINEILDFAKLEAGRMQSEAIPYQPVTIANELIRVMNSRARANGTRIELITQNVSAGDWFKGDPTHIRRLLFNLVGNAVKFTENGIIRLCISADGSDRLNYAVVDTGIGIPDSSRDKLFQPFSQVDSSTSRRYGGTGLGLVICKRIVTQMGGKIGVDSTVGVGSKFWFEIPGPRADAPASLPQQVQQTKELERGLKILVAEDQPVNRDVMSRYLKKLNQTADFVSDGSEAVAAAARRQYDLILMDMQMPVMDGIDATRNIRGFGIKTPIVALTANASDSDRDLCIQAGMDGFEVKPISLSTLSRVLQRFGLNAASGDSNGEATPVGNANGAGKMNWDEGRLDELRDVLGDAGLRGLAAAFLDDMPQLVERLKLAVDGRSAEDIDLVLHTIKGTAANLGFSGLAELAQKYRGVRPEDVDVGMLASESALAQNALSKKAA